MKKRTISLFDRRPITIVEDDWRVIATAKDWDNQYEAQADRKWRLTVRQHNDGRTIVYGVYDTRFQDEDDRRGGELLTPPEGAEIPDDEWYVWPEIPAAIRRVGKRLDFDDNLIDKCIADLPAEEL